VGRLAAYLIAYYVASAAHNPNLAETREVVLRHISESDETKDSSGGSRAMRRQEGTSVVAYKAKKRCCKYYSGAGEFHGFWCVAIKGGIEGFGGAMSKRESCAEQHEKRIP
jgi:hypothetical protein